MDILRNRALRLLGVLATGLLILAGCSSTTDAAEESTGTTTNEVETANTGALGPTQDELNTIAVSEMFGPSTAALQVTVGGQQMDSNGQPFATPSAQSAGSGFLIEVGDNQFLVTNFHVVEVALEEASSDLLSNATVVATFADDAQSQVDLDVIGVNPSFDLALLNVTNNTEFPDVLPIPMSDSDEVRKGQKTIAIGNPFGLGATVTTGIVSSTERFVQSIGMVDVPNIQTDAAINPGNSGGALLNSSGELIGINTSIFNPEARAFAGIGFAVPSNLLREALANLELGGVSNLNDTRPAFGASLGTLAFLPTEVRTEAGFPDNGVVVLDVAPGGPAEQAGLRTPEFINVSGLAVPVDPDIIVAIDGDPIETADDLNLAITYNADLGQEVILSVLRGGTEIEIPVTLGS